MNIVCNACGRMIPKPETHTIVLDDRLYIVCSRCLRAAREQNERDKARARARQLLAAESA